MIYLGKITLSELKLDIKNNSFKRVYFLYGEEDFLLSYYSNLLCDAIHNDQLKEFNFQKFDEDASVQDVAYAVQAVPLMNKLKCVLINDFDINSIKSLELEKFCELIKNIPNSTVLVIKNKLKLKLNKDTKKLISLIEKQGASLELKKLTKDQTAKQLVKWAKSQGCEFNLADANYLIDYTDDSLTNLKNEMEKLCAYCKDKKIIKRDDIENLSVKDINASVFSISDYICTGNVDKAMFELDKLLFQKEEPIMILAVLASAFIDIYRVKMIDCYKKTDACLIENFDYKNKAFKLRIARKNTRYFSLINLQKIINLFTKADITLKSQKCNSRIILEKLFTEIISLKNKI